MAIVFPLLFMISLTVESDSSNAIPWVSSPKEGPLKLHFLLSQIKELESSMQVVYKHVGRSINGKADFWLNNGLTGMFLLWLICCSFNLFLYDIVLLEQ